MNLFQAFSMAIKSIKNNKARSFLTMLGIIIGVSAVITLVTLIQGSQQDMLGRFSSSANKITINFWSDRDLTQAIYNKCLEMTDTVLGVTPESQTRSRLRYREKSWDTSVYFGSDQYDICNNYQIEAGSMFTYTHVKDHAKVAVIGSLAKEQLFNFEDPVGKEIKISGVTFKIIGVFEQKSSEVNEWSPDNLIVVPYTNNRLLQKSTKINNFSVLAKDTESAEKATEELRVFLRPKFKQEWDYNIYSENETIGMLNEQMLIMSLIGGGVAGISLIVGGIGIMNIMLVSVTERTREIGIRKAIGARRGSIIVQFLIEAATVSLGGGILGILFGVLFSAVGGKILFKAMTTILVPEWYVVIGAALFSMAIGVFFGFYPANKASKLNPIDALRAE